MKHIYFISTLILLLISCKKNNDNNIERFPLIYKLINNGDRNLYKMNLYSKTYFPLENRTLISNFSKSKEYYQDMLNVYDTILYQPKILGYKSCEIYVSIHFYFIDSLNDEIVINYNYYDTISDLTQSNITFSWPEDTLSSKFNPF